MEEIEDMLLKRNLYYESASDFSIHTDDVPVKKIAQKIYTDTPIMDDVEDLEEKHVSVDRSFDAYYDFAKTYKTIMPDLKGMPAMDALTLLENMGMRVELRGNGKVKNQSVPRGTKLKPKQTIVLDLS